MLNFSLSPQAASYISALLAERPIKEAGLVALDWQRQGEAEQARINAEAAAKVKADTIAEYEASKATPTVER